MFTVELLEVGICKSTASFFWLKEKGMKNEGERRDSPL